MSGDFTVERLLGSSHSHVIIIFCCNEFVLSIFTLESYTVKESGVYRRYRGMFWVLLEVTRGEAADWSSQVDHVSYGGATNVPASTGLLIYHCY